MTLVSIKQELVKARQGCYAIPLFDVFDMHGMEGMMEAMAEKRAPTIIGVYTAHVNQPYSRGFAAYLRCRAEETDIPMSLMLDHGASVELCLRALDYGFTDVMIDSSKLSLDENIANTKKVVEAAHARGAAVEAELGHVGEGKEYDSVGARRIGFTDPDVVELFVRETGVDMLAIAFGTAHGFYKGEPRLDLDLVAEISRRVDIPLVMHGGTGLSNEQFHSAIAAGISKINFATAIINASGENMRAIAAKSGGFFEMNDGIRAAYKQWCADMYDVFGTTGKF